MLLGIGDWGLGIGPIPNPQSPIPKLYKHITINKIIKRLFNFTFSKLLIYIKYLY